MSVGRRPRRRPVIGLAVVVLLLLTAASPVRAAAGGVARASRAGTFGLESLGGSWPMQKAAVVAHPGRIDAFLVGWDHQLYHYWQVPGRPFLLEPLGGSFKHQSVSAVSWDIHHRNVFAVGTDNKLYHYYQGAGDGSFHRQLLGGEWVAPGLLEAVSQGPNRWDVFITGDAASTLAHYWWPVYGLVGPQLGYESLGRVEGNGLSMSATAWPGRLDVFLVERARGLVHFWQRAGEPFRQELMPDLAWVHDTHVDSVSWAHGRLDVFTSGSAGSSLHFTHYWQTLGSGWQRETADLVTSDGLPKPIAAVSWGEPRLDFFSTFWSDSGLLHYWQENSDFRREPMGGWWTGDISAVSSGRGRLDVFAVGTNSQLYHYWQHHA